MSRGISAVARRGQGEFVAGHDRFWRLARQRQGAALLLGGFLVLALSVQVRWTVPLDTEIAVAASRVELEAGPLEPLLSGLTILGGVGLSAVLGAGLGAWLWWRRWGWRAAAPLLLVAAILVEVLLKSVVYQPDTAYLLVSHRPLHATVFPPFPLNLVRPPYAFPSGHAARLAFLATLSLRFGVSRLPARSVRLVVGTAVALGVLLSAGERVYTGEHWFSDVIGGLLLGVWLGVVAVEMLGWRGDA